MQPTDQTPPLDANLGRTLGDRYRLDARLGSGGMSTVYRARDLRLGRDVAVKVMHPHLGDAEFVRRFRQEAEFAASVSNHPNIISIFDVGEDAGLNYIVMEFADGTNLKDLIREHGPLPVERAMAIGQGIAAALSFAHSQRLVHRDIKPQNVIILPGDVVKVGDFGIARSAESSQVTTPGTVMGTAHYISPEQAQGQPAGPSSDVYSLGVVLYEMLTARLPFEGDNAISLAMKHVHEEPPPPNRFNTALPPIAAAIVLKALNKNPANRFASAAEFGTAMRDLAIPAQDTIPFTTVPAQQPDETMVVAPITPAAQGTAQRSAPVPVARNATAPNPWRTTLLTLLALLVVGGAATGGFFIVRAMTATPANHPGHPRHTPTPTPTKKKPTPTPTKTKVRHTPTPTPSPSPTPTATPTLSPSPTPTATPSPSPTPTATPTPTPVPATSTPTPTPTPSSTATPTPTPTPL